jgi:hypothetical protein
MPIQPLPLGNGVTLDVDDTTVKDGSAVSFINGYLDRGGAFRAIPGCELYADTGEGGAKTWAYYCVNHSRLFVVANGRIWQQTVLGAALEEITGALFDADAVPTFAEDGTNVFFAANSEIHKITGTTATDLGDGAPINVTSLVFIGGYLMAKGDDRLGAVSGDTHYSDDKDNGYATWEVYNNESRPDALQSLIVAYEQIYNIGTQTVEVSYIDGTVPFSVNKNASQQLGTPAPASCAFDGENIYYLSVVANGRKVVQLKGGGSPQIVSFPVDIPIETFERVDDAHGFIMAFNGQNGYAITFPSANAVVDEQYYESITLFYHLQTKQWIVLGQWDADNGVYEAYRGVSFTYAEPWGLRLIGGRDGKVYKLISSEESADEPVFVHRWRDNGQKEWKPGRTIVLGSTGQYGDFPTSRQCGLYRGRQHEFIYSDLSDAGEIFRAALRTGHITWGAVHRQKRAICYRYDVRRGKPGFVLNGVTEEFETVGN